MKTFELSERDFPGADDQYIKNLNFLSLLGYDIYMKKKIMERIIDEMAAEQAKEQEQTNGKEKKIKEENKRKNKKRRGVNYASSFSLDGSAGRSVRVTRSIRFLCTSVTLKWAPSQ